MRSATAWESEEAKDRATTLRNRARLHTNRNLLFWYRELYRDQFKDLPSPETLSILESGSGTSPLKQFHSNIVTSDILQLDYLDLVFDCHETDKLDAIKDKSLDVITLTNVLHHLKSPIAFLSCAAGKLKPGGKVIATESFFSVLSTAIFSICTTNRSISGFPSLSWAKCRGRGQHRIALADFFPEARLAATLE